MEENRVRFLTDKVRGKVSNAALIEFKANLMHLGDDAFAPLMEIKLKSKAATILLSIFLGGLSMGRFYLGDTKYAVGKLLTAIAAAFCSEIPFLGPILSLGIAIWSIVDIFLCVRRVKEVNNDILYRTIKTYRSEGGL